MKINIKMLWGVLAICAGILSSAHTSDAQSPISVTVNNKLISFDDAEPYNDHGTVFIPLRSVSQAMGAAVQYNPLTHNIQLNYRQKTIVMKVGSDYANVDGREVTLGKPLPVIQNRMFIPLRFVAESFGARVSWDGVKNLVAIRELVNWKQPQHPGIRAGNIEVRTRISKSTFHVGESVYITVTAINTDDQPRSVSFPTGQTFDIIVSPIGKTSPQWNWSRGRLFTTGIRTVELKPGEEISLTGTWLQKDNRRQPVPRGVYEVRSKLTSMNGGIDAPMMNVNLVK